MIGNVIVIIADVGRIIVCNEIVYLGFFRCRIQVMAEFYISIPISFINKKFSDRIGACFGFSLV